MTFSNSKCELATFLNITIIPQIDNNNYIMLFCLHKNSNILQELHESYTINMSRDLDMIQKNGWLL